jgi:NAD(P)-dependent dehydrogenase (short-subunit alcohol dehydrogenase family)
VSKEFKNVTYDFSGQTALITGGGRGQGRAHALAFAEAGADVAICEPEATFDSVPYPVGGPDDLNSTAAEVEALGVKCMPAVCDVRDSAQVKTLIDDTVAGLGKIDILINNAGVDSIYGIADLGEREWDELLDINLKGVFLCSKFACEEMIPRGRGKILATGSINSHVGTPRQSHYVASKHGVLGFVRALAVEVAPHGITVNAVCPGAVDTPMAAGLLNNPDGEWLEQLPSLTGPFNLFEDGVSLEPQEISAAMLWLASDAADHVTGTSITVDAGFSVK